MPGHAVLLSDYSLWRRASKNEECVGKIAIYCSYECMHLVDTHRRGLLKQLVSSMFITMASAVADHVRHLLTSYPFLPVSLNQCYPQDKP